jgi:hypothetical protein
MPPYLYLYKGIHSFRHSFSHPAIQARFERFSRNHGSEIKRLLQRLNRFCVARRLADAMTAWRARLSRRSATDFINPRMALD